MRTVKAVDLFCGAGGTSSGFIQACKRLGLSHKLIAINHWQVAIATHKTNHPGTRHICEDIDNVNPRHVVPGGRLDILLASPECTHHSNARGGKPMNEQSRASAWHILRWAEALYIKDILIENVREFINWGPIGSSGRPMSSRKGELFRLFIQALETLGYRVSWNVLNSADYGDPTCRRRLFILATRGRKGLKWPEPTHSKTGEFRMIGPTKPWRTAREIIDWQLTGKSIFNRKRPLADSTMNRIAAGLKKFGGEKAEPFLVMLYGTGKARSVDKPTPTVTGGGQHIGLCEPFLVQLSHTGPDNEHSRRTRSLDQPLPVLTSKADQALVEPFLISTNYSTGDRVRSVKRPMPTVTGSSGFVLVEPFLVKYNGTGKARSVNEPLDTITSKDRFAVVETASGRLTLDIRFRMLQPHELALAMSFDESYEFKGNKTERVKQVGNAVPVRTARALCEALIGK